MVTRDLNNEEWRTLLFSEAPLDLAQIAQGEDDDEKNFDPDDARSANVLRQYQ